MDSRLSLPLWGVEQSAACGSSSCIGIIPPGTRRTKSKKHGAVARQGVTGIFFALADHTPLLVFYQILAPSGEQSLQLMDPRTWHANLLSLLLTPHVTAYPGKPEGETCILGVLPFPSLT